MIEKEWTAMHMTRTTKKAARKTEEQAASKATKRPRRRIGMKATMLI